MITSSPTGRADRPCSMGDAVAASVRAAAPPERTRRHEQLDAIARPPPPRTPDGAWPPSTTESHPARAQHRQRVARTNVGRCRAQERPRARRHPQRLRAALVLRRRAPSVMTRTGPRSSVDTTRAAAAFAAAGRRPRARAAAADRRRERSAADRRRSASLSRSPSASTPRSRCSACDWRRHRDRGAHAASGGDLTVEAQRRLET